jgi:hypothetical protein
VPSKDPIQRFEDLLENAILIEEFTRGVDLNSFLDDLKTRNATERCLERISEAARKLGDLAEVFRHLRGHCAMPERQEVNCSSSRQNDNCLMPVLQGRWPED